MYGNMYNNPYANYQSLAQTTGTNVPIPNMNLQAASQEDGQTSETAEIIISKSSIPMTIKQIHNTIQTSDTRHIYYGKYIQNVIIVGRVTSEQSNQVINYTIHDGTGRIQGKLYIGQNNTEMSSITNGYARIIGSLSYTNDIYSINIHHIERITSYNQVIAHFLNAILSCTYYKKHNTQTTQNKLEVQTETNDILSTPSDLSTTIEMMVIQAFHTLDNSNSKGASVTDLVNTLTVYGVTLEQVKSKYKIKVMYRSTLSEMERDMKVISVGADIYKLNTMI